MELDDGAVNDLVALGLSRYEARVYLTLVRRESYTAAEVARAADVPRQRVYDVLDALARRRLAIPRPGRVAAFSAVSPELALARLMALQRESLERLDQAAAVLATALTPVWSAGQAHTDPLDYIEVLRDPKAIAERFASIQEQATHELLSFCKPPSSPPRPMTKASRPSAGCAAPGDRPAPSTPTMPSATRMFWRTCAGSARPARRPASPGSSR
ncbi:TrmB family transcriptional regulator [Streptomyces lavendulae]|uniref:TrmB family transcriptional regulator n=1 Tax=Streptomyces lavendulae TaxID=1914 RepID=UPI0036E59B7A